MLIRDVKKLPDGKIVSFEGQIKHCKQPDLEGGKWRQMVNLADRTGNIWVTLDQGRKFNPVSNGTCINIVRGKMKEGAVEILEYKIYTQSEPDPGSVHEYKPDAAMTKTDWDKKDKRMAKMCALNNAAALVVCLADKGLDMMALKSVDTDEKINPTAAIKSIACEFLDWIYEEPKLRKEQENAKGK